jgi:hypothetical protein
MKKLSDQQIIASLLRESQPVKPYCYILGMRFDEAKVYRVERFLRGFIYLAALALHLMFIMDGHLAFLEVYETFGISPPASILFFGVIFRYWYLHALVYGWIFLYFYVHRKKNWPVWLMLGILVGVFVYYEISFSLVKRGGS